MIKSLVSSVLLLVSKNIRMKKYEVALVGAGPGDPDLLTVKALKLVQVADVLLYDALIDERILNETKPECLKIYSGKKFKDGQDPMLRQANIHALMEEYYHKGCRVVRLKAGDPMIFGRGMEEIRYLQENNIAWEMVPGISAANAAASQFALPITERGFSRMVMFTSAYTESGDSPASDPYLSVLKEGGSVVFYMGLSKLGLLLKEIEIAGITDVIVAVADCVSQKDGFMVKSNAETILNDLKKHTLKGPSLLILGKHL